MQKVEYVLAEKLKTSEINPRHITPEAFERLKKSLDSENGKLLFEKRPCLVNKRADGTLAIFGGNMRYRAAVSLGWKEIPCIVDALTPDQERELTIKDNLVVGDYDEDLLSTHFDMNDLLNWGFDPKTLEITPVEEEKQPDLGEIKMDLCPNCGYELNS